MHTRGITRKLVTTLAVAIVATIVATISPASADPAPVLELRESFADVADGPAPTTLLDGAAPVANHQLVDGSAPWVRDGFLTTADPDAAVAGSYRIARLGADVTRVGATFAFTEHTTAGGLLCLSIQAGSIAEDGPVPVSPVHLVIHPGGWEIDANAEAGTGVESVTGGRFAEPLVSDGRTLHTVEILLDRAAGVVRLSLPDGSTETLVWSGFNLPGAHVYVEPFKTPGNLGEKADALVREWWASSEPVTLGAVAQPEPAPAVTEVEAQAPKAPRKVRATRDGRRVVVTWREVADADRYRVRCGARAKTSRDDGVTLRAAAKRCSVRAISTDGVSAWVRVRVRS